MEESWVLFSKRWLEIPPTAIYLRDRWGHPDKSSSHVAIVAIFLRGKNRRGLHRLQRNEKTSHEWLTVWRLSVGKQNHRSQRHIPPLTARSEWRILSARLFTKMMLRTQWLADVNLVRWTPPFLNNSLIPKAVIGLIPITEPTDAVIKQSLMTLYTVALILCPPCSIAVSYNI